MARPPGDEIHINPEEILRWAKTGATHADIANRLHVSTATLERRLRRPKYREALMAGRGELNISLRAKQVQVALSGNVTMLKWLGEQYLGQSHSHRIVDKDGEDRSLDLASVRAYIKDAPEDGE